jgi:hypothetical protein
MQSFHRAHVQLMDRSHILERGEPAAEKYITLLFILARHPPSLYMGDFAFRHPLVDFASRYSQLAACNYSVSSGGQKRRVTSGERPPPIQGRFFSAFLD